jgi:hypothetical protein
MSSYQKNIKKIHKFKIGWKYVYLERRMYKIVVSLLLKIIGFFRQVLVYSEKLTRLKELPNNLAYS